jgi:penicillin-binding protein-related factor A (putative recombinase)
MPSNPGKRFEEDFKNSIPAGVYFYRLKDAGGWAASSELRFTPRNDFDSILYAKPLLFCLELKSVAEGRWAYNSLRENQRAGLLRASDCGAEAGVLLNFRSAERTFFVHIVDLIAEQKQSGKKSLNVADAERIGVELTQARARTRMRYAVLDFIEYFRSELG